MSESPVEVVEPVEADLVVEDSVEVVEPAEVAEEAVKPKAKKAPAKKAVQPDVQAVEAADKPKLRLRPVQVRINRNGTLPEGYKYVARKTLRLNGRTVKPGTDVPEAASWPRVESWVRAGYLDIKEA